MSDENTSIEQLSEEKAKELLDVAMQLEPGSEEQLRALKSADTAANIRREERKIHSDAKANKNEDVKFYVKCGLDVAAIVLPLICYRKSLLDMQQYETNGAYITTGARAVASKVSDLIRRK